MSPHSSARRTFGVSYNRACLDTQKRYYKRHSRIAHVLPLCRLITASITSESTTSSLPVRPAPALPAPEGSPLTPAGHATALVGYEPTGNIEIWVQARPTPTSPPRLSTPGLTVTVQRELTKARVTPSPSSGEESQSEWAPTPARPGCHPPTYSSSGEGGDSAVTPPRAQTPRAAAPMVHGRRSFAPGESCTLCARPSPLSWSNEGEDPKKK
ncbi:hypothetical protein ScPMuIL_003890 [Solemya velum]